MERNLITYPTWERYVVLSTVISRLQVRERRIIFQQIRKTPAEATNENLFFPRFGFTFGEFAVWHILADGRRKSKASEES